MDGPRLSDREQRILAQIEATLGQDKHLEYRLRTLRLSVWVRCVERIRRVRGRALAVLAVASMSLLVAAICTSAPGLIAALAVTWAVTLVLGFTALCAWTRRSQP